MRLKRFIIEQVQCNRAKSASSLAPPITHLNLGSEVPCWSVQGVHVTSWDLDHSKWKSKVEIDMDIPASKRWLPKAQRPGNRGRLETTRRTYTDLPISVDHPGSLQRIKRWWVLLYETTKPGIDKLCVTRTPLLPSATSCVVPLVSVRTNGSFYSGTLATHYPPTLCLNLRCCTL